MADPPSADVESPRAEVVVSTGEGLQDEKPSAINTVDSSARATLDTGVGSQGSFLSSGSSTSRRNPALVEEVVGDGQVSTEQGAMKQLDYVQLRFDCACRLMQQLGCKTCKKP